VPFRLLCANESHALQLGVQALCQAHGCPIDRFVSSVQELETAIKDDHFDVLITDARLGANDMMEYVDHLLRQVRDFRVILYTDIPNPTLVAQAVAYRFFDVVFQSGAAMKLIRSIEALEVGIPSQTSPLVRFQEFLRRRDMNMIQPAGLGLTRREIQVLASLSMGLTNREIGFAIELSTDTVKEHVHNIFRKLKIHDRTAAAVWAIRNGVPTVTIEEADLS
jgi:DNA-binding NarL/FixJ family response regulator